MCLPTFDSMREAEKKMRQFETSGACAHCWHARRGPLLMVLRDGHVAQQCCKCGSSRTIHADHAHAPIERRGIRP